MDRALTGIVVGICTLELVIDAGIATGMVWPLGSCKSTGKVPETGLEEERREITTSKQQATLQLRLKTAEIL